MHSWSVHSIKESAQMSINREADNKTWYIHTVKFYSVIKKKMKLNYTGKCMELRNVN